RAGGGLAQRHGIAGAAGDLTPDDGRFEPAPRLVLGADAPGGDVAGLGLLRQKLGVEQLEERGVAARQPVARRPRALRCEEALEFPTQFEHRPLRRPSVPPWNAPDERLRPEAKPEPSALTSP